MTVRLAIDIGGTFTDVVLEQDENVFMHKLLTTYSDPAVAVMNGVEHVLSVAKVTPASISLVIHGTTLATNSLIERSGAKTALLTTAGHRDILEMAFENRFEQYDINIDRTQPLVPRRLRLAIEERIGARGNVLLPLNDQSIDDAIELLEQEKVESVALGFLHAYANDEHETRVAERVRSALPDVALSLSSEVCPEIREYERLSTTCANAYVLPLMSRYLKVLSTRIEALGCTCPFLVMTSGGGLTTLETASRFPIRLVESGPAGGAILAAERASALGFENVLSFDMGGSTAKICLIDNGQPLFSRSFEVDRRYRFKKGSGLPVRIPVIEMVEIGAGGGSIAAVDKLQRIQVGPESSGSEPGPACYGLGGLDATVTDADVVLGRLDPDNFAEGQMQLDENAATTAIEHAIATNLNLSVPNAAHGVAEIVDENMSAAARIHATEWGKTVEQRTMIAFGGAAPIHAARLLEKLNLDRVVVPMGAGVGSALGFLRAPVSYEVVRSRYMRLSQFDHEDVKQTLSEMREEAQAVIKSATTATDLQMHATALMRYAGQGYEISVGFDPEFCDREQLFESFNSSYRVLYGRLIPDSDVEIMSWTLSLGTIPSHSKRVTPYDQYQAYTGDVSHVETIENGSLVHTIRVNREALLPGVRLEGPALVTERHTTTVVPSGFVVMNSRENDLVMERIGR